MRWRCLRFQLLLFCCRIVVECRLRQNNNEHAACIENERCRHMMNCALSLKTKSICQIKWRVIESKISNIASSTQFVFRAQAQSGYSNWIITSFLWLHRWWKFRLDYCLMIIIATRWCQFTFCSFFFSRRQCSAKHSHSNHFAATLKTISAKNESKVVCATDSLLASAI